MRDEMATRRDFLRLVGAGGAGLALTGCVGQAAAPESSAPSSSAVDPADAKGTVDYWNSFTGEDERAGFQTVTDAFATAFPKIDLQVEAVPNADFMTKFTTAVQSGSGPDTVMSLMERFQDMAGMDGLRDLSGYVKGWDGLDQIDQKLLDPLTVDGKLLALPVMSFVYWGYYRADWFEEAGIAGPPSTWDEFRETAKALTDPAKGRYGYGMRGGAGGGSTILEIIYAYNGPLVTEDGKASLDMDATVEALQLHLDMYSTDKSVPPSAPNDSYNQMFQSFLTGGTGMLLHHTGSLKSVEAALKPMEQVKTFVLPKAKHPSTWVMPGSNGIMKTSDNADAAFAWLSYWATAKPQIDFLKATGYWPTAKDALDDPFIASDPLYETAKKAVSIGVTPTFFRGFQGWQDTVVLLQTQNVLVGRATPQQAAKEIIDQLKTITTQNA